jgi:hypothetical protein
MKTEAVHDRDSRLVSFYEIDPMYLFLCKVKCAKRCDEALIWELLCGLASSCPATRAVSECLLADCLSTLEALS